MHLDYRPPVLIATGVFLYATNLTLLRWFDLPIGRLLGLGPHAARATYQIAILYALFILAAALVGLPGLMWLALLATLVVPRLPYYEERQGAIRQFGRLAIGGLGHDTDRLLDIIVADVLTSFARVFGDVSVILLSPISLSNRGFTAFAICIPYLIRFRQCLIEYGRTHESRHLANAAKYCTAFPVILISALQGSAAAGGVVGSYVSEPHLRKIWLVSCVVNSGYSLWWDIYRDWDFDLARADLRTEKSFSLGACWTVISVDTVLRFAWVAKLVVVDESDMVIFVLELIEPFRRWAWIFFRVECEHARHAYAAIEL